MERKKELKEVFENYTEAINLLKNVCTQKTEKMINPEKKKVSGIVW